MGYIGIGVFYVAFFIKQGAVDFSLLFHSGGIGLHNHTLIPVIVDMVAIKHRQPAVEHSRITLTFLIIMAAEKHLIQPLQPTGCVITFNTAISFQQPFNILGISIQVAHNQIAYRTVMLYIRHGEQGKQHLMPFLRVPLAEMDIGYVDSVSGNSFFKPHSGIEHISLFHTFQALFQLAHKIQQSAHIYICGGYHRHITYPGIISQLLVKIAIGLGIPYTFKLAHECTEPEIFIRIFSRIRSCKTGFGKLPGRIPDRHTLE